jgi:transposase
MERDEAARQDWRTRAETLPGRRIVVLDETSTHLDMTSRYARAPRGQRAYARQRRNYGKNITLLAGLRLEGMCAPFVVEGGVNTAVFETYIVHILLPTLQAGDILILDNLAVHKSARVRRMLHARGVSLLFLPAYSPDLSPIENAFAKLKAFLRRVRAQTIDALIEAIAQALDSISPYDAIGFFVNAGFFNLDL